MATSPDLCNSFFTICCDHAFILCYFCNMLSRIVLEIACPEALHTSGCFDSHINMIYLAGCVLFTSRWSSHSLLFCGGKGKSDGFTRGSQRFRKETLERVALSLVSTKCRQSKHIITLSCHSDIFADFGQVCDHYYSYFVCHY